MPEIPVFAVIMAGGQGARLWPLSRVKRPKQFLSLTDNGRSLLQEAVRRGVELTGSIQSVLVVTQADHANLTREQLPELSPENIILEPGVRNTAPCLALAAYYLKDRAPNAVMAVLPVDHLYVEERLWFEAVHAAAAYASENPVLAAIGLKPQEPSSNYGYLRIGKLLIDRESCPVYKVLKYVEKPDRNNALTFFESDAYLWNTGTFSWQVGTFWRAVESYMPQVASTLSRLDPSLPRRDITKVYPSFDNISVDYAIMEKSSDVVVVRGDFQRIDVGSLDSLSALWQDDPTGNAVMGESLVNDSRDNIVFTDEGLVGLLGIQGLVVVRSGDIVLVCPRERVSEVREMVSQLQRSGRERYL